MAHHEGRAVAAPARSVDTRSQSSRTALAIQAAVSPTTAAAVKTLPLATLQHRQQCTVTAVGCQQGNKLTHVLGQRCEHVNQGMRLMRLLLAWVLNSQSEKAAYGEPLSGQLGLYR